MQDPFEALVPAWLRTASLVAAVLTVPAVILDVIEGLPSGLDAFGTALNWTVWSVFLLTLVVALVRAETPWGAVRANPILPIVVVLTVPVMPAGLQIVRLVRLGALFGAAHHARRLFSMEGLRYAAVVLGVVMVGGGAVFAAVEHAQHLSLAQGIWFTMETVTTVGYGDIVPHTEAGRAVAATVMVTGIGTAALLVGAASQRFVAGGADDQAPKLTELHDELRALRSEVAALREELRRS